MADADLVIHDAQYTPEEYVSKKTWGHSSFDYVVQIAAAAGVRRVALTHHDPAHDDTFVADIEYRARSLALQCGTGLEVFCAYEGCELVLEPGSALKPYVIDAPPQSSVAHRRFHILVVDDQPVMLKLIVRALEEHYTVGTANSGKAALEMIAECVPDLVILDYKMMGMDGLEVMRTLRAGPETQSLQVLMLTGMTDEASTRAGFEAGVTDYVTKPFSIPQLTARVRACLTRNQS
jgi:CheY-like chemotaxis protein